LEFKCTNNIAEYEAILLGLRKLRAMGIRRAVLKSDSQVITGQVDKRSKASNWSSKSILTQSKGWRHPSKIFQWKNIPRGDNEQADLLAKSATLGLPLPSKVFFETLKAPSVELMVRVVLTISPMLNED
jgi:ribonuclease HI